MKAGYASRRRNLMCTILMVKLLHVLDVPSTMQQTHNNVRLITQEQHTL